MTARVSKLLLKNVLYNSQISYEAYTSILTCPTLHVKKKEITERNILKYRDTKLQLQYLK